MSKAVKAQQACLKYVCYAGHDSLQAGGHSHQMLLLRAEQSTVGGCHTGLLCMRSGVHEIWCEYVAFACAGAAHAHRGTA